MLLEDLGDIFGVAIDQDRRLPAESFLTVAGNHVRIDLPEKVKIVPQGKIPSFLPSGRCGGTFGPV
jgi:hypothetical protein